MSINANPVNATPINGTSTVDRYFSLSLPLSLKTVRQFSLSLPLVLKTTRSFSLSLPLVLVTTDHASYNTPQTRWSAKLWLDGVDISDRIVGQIEIDREEGAAKLAKFSYLPSGVINPSSLVGKSVAIDYAHYVSGVLQPSVRRFTGLVDVPDLDVTTGAVSISATDNRQNSLVAATREQIDALTLGAMWSPWVFDEKLQGLEYVEARLSTLAASLDKDAQGAFRLTPWAAKAVADFSYGMGQHFYATPTLQIARRDRLVNTVNIEFDYRFPRLRARQMAWRWDSRMTTDDDAPGFGVPVGLPTSAMIKSAALDTGWEMILYQDNLRPPVSRYQIADLIAENAPAVEYFYMQLKKRWGQTVTEKYRLNVSATNSVSELGQLAESESTSGEVEFDVSAWEQDADALPALTVTSIGDTHADVVDREADGRAVADLAMQTLVARAISRIKASHRGNRVVFDMPLDPRLDLIHTVQITAQHLLAKGKVGQIVEKMDIESGAASMEVTLYLSGVAAVGLPSDPLNTPPAAPAAPAPLETVYEKLLFTHIGIPPDYDMEGYTPFMLEVAGIQPQFKIDTPAIADAERQPVDTLPINQTYSLVVPVDTLTWS